MATHGLDVAATLGRSPWTTGPALYLIVPLLRSLFGGPPPGTLGWDARTFFAAATGRRPLTDQDRDILGPATKWFPLLP